MLRIGLLMTTCALAACSTTPVPRSQSQMVAPNKVLAPELQMASKDRLYRVMLIRDSGFMGSALDAVVTVDGKDVVVLDPKERFEFYLAAGSHMFSIRALHNLLSEPLAESDVDIRAHGPNTFRLRLVSGDGPRIELSSQIEN